MKFATFITTAITALSLSVTSALAEAPASYATCVACHQAEGQGVAPVFPPLAGSEWVNGPVENLIRIQLRGLQGPITVKGVDYGAAAMPANATMTDDQIAEVLTYIRSSWGNNSSAVTPDMVAALRDEVGKPVLTAADLIDPTAVPVQIDTPSAPQPYELKSGEFKDQVDADNGLQIPFWAYLFFGACLVPVALNLVGKK